MNTKHHKITRSHGGTNTPDNLIILPENIHTAFHTLFEDKLVVGQIEIILGINWDALKKPFRTQAMDLLLSYSVDDIYQEHCYDRNKYINKIIKLGER